MHRYTNDQSITIRMMVRNCVLLGIFALGLCQIPQSVLYLLFYNAHVLVAIYYSHY